MAELFNIIKLLRKEKGLSQKDLGEILNIPRGTIAAWETGDRTPELAAVIKLSDYFEVTTDYLLGRSHIRHSFYSEFPNDDELTDYLGVLVLREDLKILAKQIKDLPPDSIMYLTKAIKNGFPMKVVSPG